jgi:uncharacterized protein DUF4388
MRAEPVAELLRALKPEAELRFTLRDIPFDEVLLTVHEGRFTGALDIGAMPEVDRVFFREGACVGVVPYRHLDAQLLGAILIEMKKISRLHLDVALREQTEPPDGLILGQRLLRKGLIDQETLDRACAEQARRRLFHLYESPEAPVLARAGLQRLAHFHPTFVDVRPAIAYGLVVRSAPERRAKIAALAAFRRARLVAPYDEKRNSYGLPPPVLVAMRSLSKEPVVFESVPSLPGLNPDTTAGLLLLLQRMSLVAFDDAAASTARTSS